MCDSDDGASVTTDWSDSVSVDTVATPSESTHHPLCISRTKTASEPQVTGVRSTKEDHCSDIFARPILAASLKGLSGSLNPKLSTQQPHDDTKPKPQSLCQHVLFSQQCFGDKQCSDTVTTLCDLSTAPPQKPHQSHSFEHTARNDMHIVPTMTTNTAGDGALGESRHTVSNVCVSQDAVTTTMVTFHPQSHDHHPDRCRNTVKQRPCPVFSPTVALHRPDPCIATEGDQLTHSSRSSAREQVLSAIERKTRNSQGDGFVSVPPLSLYHPPPEVSAVPPRQSCFLGHAGAVTEGRGLSVACGNRIFTHDWQPMTAEECSATTVNSYMTQTSSPTPSSKSVPITRECTTSNTVSPRGRPRVTSVDTVDLGSSIVGSDPEVDLATDVTQCVPVGGVKIKRLPQERDDPSRSRLAGNLLPGRSGDKARKTCGGWVRGSLHPVTPDGTTLRAPVQPMNMLSASHRGSGTRGCGKRTEDKPFHVQILRSLLGVGISIKVTPDGVVITDLQKTGPVAKNGSVR